MGQVFKYFVPTRGEAHPLAVADMERDRMEGRITPLLVSR